MTDEIHNFLKQTISSLENKEPVEDILNSLKGGKISSSMSGSRLTAISVSHTPNPHRFHPIDLPPKGPAIHSKTVVEEIRKIAAISKEFTEIRENVLKDIKSFKTQLSSEVNSIVSIFNGLDNSKLKIEDLLKLLELIDKPEIKIFLNSLSKKESK